MIIWIIPAVIIVGILIWLIGIYNKLVRNKNMVEEGWSGIDVQLKRRSNLTLHNKRSFDIRHHTAFYVALFAHKKTVILKV